MIRNLFIGSSACMVHDTLRMHSQLWSAVRLSILQPDNSMVRASYIHQHGTCWAALWVGGRCDRECMVVGFTTTYAISAYHHESC
jgi:hypothetical protein